jgi:lysophospholipase L1-like esterase
MTRPRWLAVLLGMVALGAALMAGQQWFQARRALSGLHAKLGELATIQPGTAVPCQDLAAAHPLVLLALGQSNAGNHGALREPKQVALPIAVDDGCALAVDPLPGGTGRGGSIWSAVPQALNEVGASRQSVVLSVLAVDATSITDWTAPDSPLRQRLLRQLGTLKRIGLAPSLVLWQQGEADAKLGTDPKAYAAGLRQLRALIDSAGSKAPVLLARSTMCRSPADAGLHAAIDQTVEEVPGFRMGPDTDALASPDDRVDGCHFSVAGQLRAARLWADRIQSSL